MASTEYQVANSRTFSTNILGRHQQEGIVIVVFVSNHHFSNLERVFRGDVDSTGTKLSI